jgi:hypothetical protein
MAFEAEASKTPAAVVLVLDRDNNLSASSEHACMDCIRIGDRKVCTLRFDAPDLIGLFNVVAEWRISDRTQHDHAAAQTQLGMCDPTLVVGYDEVLIKSEDIDEPLNRSRSVAVTKARDDG